MNDNFTFFVSKALRKLPCKKISDNFNMHRHQKIKQELKPIFDEAYTSFTRYKNHNVNNTIWIFWWQGKNSMPEIVKKCFQSVNKNCGNKKVVLITKDNIEDYTDISGTIYDKLHNGQITFTHFSDILRANLLKNNGGLWMDATLYATDSLKNIDLNKLYYCSGYPNDTFNISLGRWTGFFMGGPSGMDLMSFMDELYKCYWMQHDKLIDYFLIDYGLSYAWDKNLSDFCLLEKIYMQNNPHLFNMQSILNQPFNEKLWHRLTNDTNVFKLSYKKKVNTNDCNNFYHYLT